jgi:hypothetical protein
MPYIKEEDRKKFKDCPTSYSNLILELASRCTNEGELNYLITSLCLHYLNKKGESYKRYNSIIGVLECAKLELYRRYVSKYEDKKIEENGDL